MAMLRVGEWRPRVRGREQSTLQTVKVKALTMLEASQPKPTRHRTRR
jgi:hypothetical protein